ncbi:MAG: CHAD domain-containing protein [Acetobacteraceae bacterium]|nr:CHAD domain-containing protein [Acetobacteraceae bacterium]
MQFELSIEPETAAKLPRLALLAHGRSGRAKSLKQRIIWHDSPNRALAAAGLALAEQHGIWRLERLYPGAEDWPPAAPAPLLAQDADPTLLGIALPDALAPVAAFDGHSTEYTIATDHGPVTLQRLRGGLRAVAAERPIARLLLSGAEPAVLTVARALCEALEVSVPRASLAAEALAAADSTPPRPRRLGPPLLPANISIGDAFAHALGHLTDVILHHAPDAAAGRGGPESVHQMRVAVRRLRSAITVFRAAIASEPVSATDTALKALAQRLGPARDWDVFVTETAAAVTEVLPHDDRLQRLLGAAERRQKGSHAALTEYLESRSYRSLGIELAWLAGARTWHAALDPMEQEALGRDLAEFAAQVLQRRLKKLRAAGEDIETLDVVALHALRLRAKRMRYAAEILAPLFPGKLTKRFIGRLSVLQARLGTLNDRAVATSLLHELGGPAGRHGYAVGVVVGFVGAGSAVIRPRIIRTWEKFLRQAPFWA